MISIKKESMSKIFLVRHAQSESNADLKVLINKTNIAINLTETGVLQAREVGLELAKYHNESKETIKIWNSPYFRTRETAHYIKESLKQSNISYAEEESIYICERQFGLLDDNQDSKHTHIKEHNHYMLHVDYKHDFWARPPLGESAFDMCLRLDNFIRTVMFEKHYDNHIIVSHGAAIRGFITMKQKISFEKYTAMPNPHNASVSLIDGEEYKGVVFTPKTLSLG